MGLISSISTLEKQAFTYVLSVSPMGEITGEENLLAQSCTAYGEEMMWVQSNLDLFALVVQLFTRLLDSDKISPSVGDCLNQCFQEPLTTAKRGRS